MTSPTLPAHTDPQQDAGAILSFTLHRGAPPLGLDANRIERALAWLTIYGARRADEDPRVVDRLADVGRQLSGMLRAQRALDREAEPASTPQPKATPEPGNGRRVVTQREPQPVFPSAGRVADPF